MNLKEVEKKAFMSTYQDGLWDIYYGLIVLFMAVFLDRPEEGYSWVNLVLMAVSFLVAYLLFRAGKKYITTPRLGEVVFGPMRRQKKRKKSIILAVFVFLQVLFLLLSVFVWMDPGFAAAIGGLANGRIELLTVSLLASLIVCLGMTISAYFSDYLRGYYIAVLMAAAVFLILFFDRPLYPVLVSLVIILPGGITFLRFLKKYPLRKSGDEHNGK